MIERNKLLGLEVIRFLSAFTVVFSHYHFLCDIGIRHTLTSMAFYPFYDSLPFLYFLSEWAVRIFWCISGFIFFWKYQSLIADRAVNFWDFVISRFARLYPLHVLTLCIVAIGQGIYFHLTGFHFLNDAQYSAPHFISQLFMASNRIFTGDSFNWPIWSVSIEISVYLLFFIVTRYMTRSILFNIFIVLIFLVVNLAMPKTPFMGLLECLLFFYIGGAASIFKKYSLEKGFPCHLAWIGAGLIPLFFWLAGGFSSLNTVFLFWSIWLPVLLYCASDDLKVNAWIRKIIEALGNMTYSSYLIHLPVQLILAVICFLWKIYLPVFNPLFLAGYLFLIFFLSHFIHRHFELPMKKAVKSAITGAGPYGMKLYHYIFIAMGIFVHLCLAFTPIISLLDKNDSARLLPTLSMGMDYTKSGKALLDAGRYTEAMAVYKQALARYPYDPDDYANLGIVYFKMGNAAEALVNLDKALSMSPNYFMVYNNRGVIYNAQGRYDLALQDFNKALTIDPCPDSILKRVSLETDRGNYAAHLDDPQKAMCLDSAQLYSNLGFIETLQKNYDRAIVHLSKAIARDPDLGKAYENRAICYFAKKDNFRCRQDAQKAEILGIKVNPILLRAP